MLAILLAATAAPVPFTPQVWTQLRAAAARAVSFDGKRILYVVSHGVAKGKTAQEWWTIASSGANASRIGVPKGFTPDGFTIDGAFYGTYESDKAPPQIAVWRSPAVKPHVLTHLAQGVGALAISPDGRHIATLASNQPKDPLDDVRTVVENDISTPYVVSADGSGGKWWCPGVTSVADFAWSPDSSSLALLSQTPKIGYHYVTGALDVCRSGGAARVAQIPNAASSLAWIGGTALAFVSTKTPTLTPEHVYTVSVSGGIPIDRTPDLAGTANALAGDSRGRIWVSVTHGVQTEIDRFSGGVLRTAYSVPGGSVGSLPVFSPFRGAADRLAITIGDPSHSDNVAMASGAQLRRITHEGDDLLARTSLGRVQVVHWSGPESALTGIVTFPPGYVPGRKYPFVNVPHGGPEASDELRFDFFSRLVATRGYVVMQPQYRGSTGVNSAFTAAIYQHFGDRAYRDVESATDYAIAQGWADPKHLGMFGWSAGGFMTSWTITQTARYRAAVEGAGITDWLSFVPTSDLSQIDYDARSHITDPQAFLQYSAVMFANRVTTPLLILHGGADLRVPTFQGREYFVFLRELGKTARMVTYPGSPHFPRLWEQRRNVFDEVFAWFDRYL